MAKLLMEGLLLEMKRASDLITVHNKLPNGRDSIASLLEKDIQDAEKAIASGDVIQMLICFKSLKFSEIINN